jgi:nicotinamide phosphoribosyltransferase
MITLIPENQTDFYKTGHIRQYPPGTEQVYTNFTARSNRLVRDKTEGSDTHVVVFQIQAFIEYFIRHFWNFEFFNQPKDEVLSRHSYRMLNALGPGAVSSQPFADLWELGYLPIMIKALPEGTLCPMGVPFLTITNTHPDFYWLPNYLETAISAEIWKYITNATTAYEFRKIINEWQEKTGSNPALCIWQGHDFSMRGMSGLEDAAKSAAAHLLSFSGTDTISGIDYLERYYWADAGSELIGGSVAATEHSVMCLGGKQDEIETIRRIIQDEYNSGIVSIVSDTWDYWKVITEIIPQLKDVIEARVPDALGNAKVVIRPDSGDPIKIITGYMLDEYSETINPDGTSTYRDRLDGRVLTLAEIRGSIVCLYDTFGGSENAKGYKELNPRIGLIYGDSITRGRARDIFNRLERKGFASSNVVFGIGSYTYQNVTRDTYGMAVKSTYGVVDGESRVMFKDPKTDNGSKKSAAGLLRVDYENGDYVLRQNVTPEEEAGGELKTVFLNGNAVGPRQTLAGIRARLGVY